MDLKTIYEDRNVLVVEKPARMIVFSENNHQTVIDQLLKNHPELKEAGPPPRYGIVHRLDKDTSGILLVAKDRKTLDFLQDQFKQRKVEKRYRALVTGNIERGGSIKTLIGRAPKNRKKQKAYLPFEPGAKDKREALTEYEVLQKFKEYTLIEARPHTGRKHQIRCHLAHLGHPIAGDKLYGFKDQKKISFKRQFLHASYLKISLPDNKVKEFFSELPEDLQEIINNLEKYEQ